MRHPQILGNFGNTADDAAPPSADPEDPEIVAKAKQAPPEVVEYTFAERDVILYNLGVGATAQELQWTFEGHDQFAALPTFGVIPQFAASGGLALDFLPDFNPVRPWRCFIASSAHRASIGASASWRAIFSDQGAYSYKWRARKRGEVSSRCGTRVLDESYVCYPG